MAREVDFSVQRGRLSVARTYTNVTGDDSPLPEELQRNAVRHARVGALREAGFTVIHTPGRIRNGTHVSIVWMGEDGATPAVPWDAGVSERFEGCFNEDNGSDEDEEDG